MLIPGSLAAVAVSSISVFMIFCCFFYGCEDTMKISKSETSSHIFNNSVSDSWDEIVN